MTDIIIAQANDWEGIYIDGVLQLEGHHISNRALAEFIADGVSQGADRVVFRQVNYTWMHENGELPLYVTDVEFFGDENIVWRKLGDAP